MTSLNLLRSKLLSNHGFSDQGFTTRTGGVSKGDFSSLNLAFEIGDSDENVAANLKTLQEEIGRTGPLVRVKQVHGSEVLDAESASQGLDIEQSWSAPPTLEADAIVSSVKGVLAVQTADCVPILLASPSTGVVAAIHAGWRSLAKDIVRKAVRAMGEKGAAAADIVAAIGPCICLKCYEVGEEVAKCFPESADPIRKKRGKYLLDLGLAAEVSLIGAGLTSDNIDRIDACTSCSPDTLFSHRRDSGNTGRMLGFIAGR